MKKIWKYSLHLDLESEFIEMPKGAEILSAQNQNGTVCIWVLVDPLAPKEKREIAVWGTGHKIWRDSNLQFIGTVQVEPFVWHVFEILADKQSKEVET